MKANRLLLLAILIVPIAATAFACAHRPEDEGERRVKDVIVLVGDRDRGYLGVSVDEVTPKLARKKNLKVEEGVYVSNVTSDSPAEKAGIKEGDVIIEYDGKKVYDNSDLVSEVRKTKPETEVQIAINRDGEKRNIKATIGRMPREPRVYSFNVPPAPRMRIAPHFSWNSSSTFYGLTIEELNRQLGEYFGAPDGRGLLVKNVKSGSEADKSGFKAGDVIVKIGKEAVDDVSDVWEALRDYRDSEKAEVEVLRKGKTEKLTLTIDEDSQRGIRYRWRDGDDVLMDFIPHEEGIHFRHEADKMKREGETLKRELNNMKDRLHDGMIDLKEKIRKEVEWIRTNVEV